VPTFLTLKLTSRKQKLGKFISKAALLVNLLPFIGKELPLFVAKFVCIEQECLPQRKYLRRFL
jgi:hypothetical protein